MSKIFESLSSQSVLPVEQNPPRDVNPDGGNQLIHRELKNKDGDLVYLWLLGVSICFSIVLCWLYVTKPVIITDSVEGASTSIMLLPSETGTLSKTLESVKKENSVVPPISPSH